MNKSLNSFSMCERDLYAEVRKLREREWAHEQAEKERTIAVSHCIFDLFVLTWWNLLQFFNRKLYEGKPLPVPRKKAENRARLGRYPQTALTEWEKNMIRPIFRELVEPKTKGVKKENLVKIMERLATDECTIGKVPNVKPEQYESLFADWRSLTPDGLISWYVFTEGCNQWPWKMMDNSKRIDDFFAQA